MSDIFSNLNDIKQKSDNLKTQKVARFAYTSVAYDNDDYAGVENYSAPAEQNIPAENKTDLNDTIINKGVRSQAASIPRNTLNHFFGRTSYNLNKLVEWFNTLITDLPRQFAANGSRYSATAKYRQYDICTFVDSTVTPPQVRYFFRSSADPAELVNSTPMTGGAVNTAQWSEYSDVAARAHSYVRRDANGRAQIAAPSADADIANRGWVRDYCIPIGMVYIQGPADAAPSTLWPGTTWTNVSSEEAGLFRRFEGGAASAFGGGTQASQNKTHSHTTGNPSSDHSHIMPNHRNGATASGGGSLQPVHTSVGSDSSTGGVSSWHTHTVSSDGGTEARPDNVTVRKWRRTA